MRDPDVTSPPPVRPRADSPGPSDDHLQPVTSGGVRRARTFASPSPSASPYGGLRRRGTAVSSRRDNSLARQATGVSISPSANFSLAGPQNPVAVAHQHQPYVDPGYGQLNPAYEQPATTRPVWSLSKPMPRVVRPGMVPTASELNVSQPPETSITEEDVEKGPDPTLRLDRVSSKLKSVNAEREKRFLEKHGVQGIPTRQLSNTSSRQPRRSTTFAQTGQEPPNVLPGVTEEDEPEQGDLGGVGFGGDGHFDIQRARDHDEFDDSLSAKTALDPVLEEGEEMVPLQGYSGIEDEVHNIHTHWSVVRLRFRDGLAEFLAVFVQLTLGFCCNNAYTVGTITTGTYLPLAWGKLSRLLTPVPRSASLPEIEMADRSYRLCIHVSNLYRWWYLRCPFESGNHDHPLCLSWIPQTQVARVHHSAALGRFCSNLRCLRTVPLANPSLCCNGHFEHQGNSNRHQ